MASKQHADYNSIRIDYRKDKVENFLGEYIYKQVKKITGISTSSAQYLFRVLDQYTLEEIKNINEFQGKISCIKRPDVRAILLRKNGKLLTGKSDTLIIGTNSIEKTDKNERGDTCPRLKAQLGSTSNKVLCALSCNHTGCAEKRLMDTAVTMGESLYGSSIILFGHTEGPCTVCSESLATRGVKSVIIGSVPEYKGHKDYDKEFAQSGYKIFLTPDHIIRHIKDK